MAGLDKNIWIIANWKSNKTISEALDWISEVGPKVPYSENLKIVVCPTFSCLSEVKKAITVGNYPIIVASQDLSEFQTGAFTGEESASLIKDLVELSIIGHSERRQNLSESDEVVAKKVERANSASIQPLVCVQGIDTPIPKDCNLVAYEPIFAIGTGTPDTSENANNVAKQIKEKQGFNLEVLYGGSVSAGNVKSFVMQENISGVLIGKASLDAGEFVKIIKELSL